MSLLAIRFALWVGLAIGVLALLWWAVDGIGDIREAKVRAEYVEAIETENVATDAANDAATKVRLRDERVRTESVAAFKATLKPAASQCLLKEDEAQTLARVR